MEIQATYFLTMLLYLDVSEHFDEVVGAAAQRQVVQDVLVHQLNVRVSQPHRAIGIPDTENHLLHNYFTTNLAILVFKTLF